MLFAGTRLWNTAHLGHFHFTWWIVFTTNWKSFLILRDQRRNGISFAFEHFLLVWMLGTESSCSLPNQIGRRLWAQRQHILGNGKWCQRQEQVARASCMMIGVLEGYTRHIKEFLAMLSSRWDFGRMILAGCIPEFRLQRHLWRWEERLP